MNNYQPYINFIIIIIIYNPFSITEEFIILNEIFKEYILYTETIINGNYKQKKKLKSLYERG